MLRSILRRFGYIKTDFGFTCGRHYLIVDGKTIAQTPGDDIWMKDGDIRDLGRAIVPGCKQVWIEPTDRGWIETMDPLYKLSHQPGVIVRRD